jgi:hypothetical protein
VDGNAAGQRPTFAAGSGHVGGLGVFGSACADADARLGADVGHYSFTVMDFHHLLLAGLPAHGE